MKSAKILIIDDEPAICKGCRLALSDQNHLVEICMTGREGMDLLEKDDFDLVLLDMKLPDMEGMEILRAVHKTKQNLQVIVMTAYSTVQNAVEAMKLGAFDYLCKPFTDEELTLVVQRAIEKKHLIEENLLLRKQLISRGNFPNIIGESPKILQIFEQVEKVAPTDSTVLLIGESGTGKELFAGASMPEVRGPTASLSRLIAVHFRPHFLKVNSLAMSGEPLPVRFETKKGSSIWPTAEPSL